MKNQKYRHFGIISDEQRMVYANRRSSNSQSWWDEKANDLGFEDEPKMLVALYWGRGRSLREIGNACNSSYQNIAWRMCKHDLPRRRRGGRNNVKKEVA